MFRLYWKIFIWFWLMLISTIIIVSWVSITLTEKSLVNDRKQQLLGSFALAAVTVLENGGQRALMQWSGRLKESFNIEVYLVDAQTGSLVSPQIESDSMKVNNKQGGLFDSSSLSKSDLIVSASIKTTNGKHFRLILSQGKEQSLISRIYSKNLLIELVCLFVLLSLITYGLSRHLVKPLFNLGKIMKSFASGNLDIRPDKKLLKRWDEIGVLAQEFAKMATKIELLVENSKQLLQDVSHELRSPLARLQIASSLIQQQLDKPKHSKEAIEKMSSMVERIDYECDQLNSLIAEILSYFRMQMDKGAIVCAEMDLVGLLNGLIDSVNYEHQLDKDHVGVRDIELNIHDEAMDYSYIGQVKLILRALENILRNAMKYTEGSRVDISIKKEHTIPAYIIKIRDYGPGVPEHMLERLFDPFFRVHSDRAQKHGGYGLGLAIAQRAILVHGGSIVASCENKSGGGLLVTVTLVIKS